MSRFWSELVHELTPYTPGEQPKVDGLIKLNTNENPYGPSPKVLEAIQRATGDDLRKYPDPSASELKQTIADHYGLTSEQVFVGNSSDEVLAHAFRALLKTSRPLLFPDITYSFYPVYCRLFGIEYRQVPLRDDFQIAVEDYAQDCGGIIFANPNAPTGIALSLSKIEALLREHADKVIVVDEAYVDFAEESAATLVNSYANLLVVQTLSKSRSLAGLRVGFALGSSELIEGLERVKNSFHPYALDKLALAGAKASFEDEDYFKQCCAKVIKTRENTINGLRSLGFEVLASQTNFVFARHSKVAAKDLFQGLRENKILVRHFSDQRISDFIRISVGTDDDMQTCIDCLTTLVNA